MTRTGAADAEEALARRKKAASVDAAAESGVDRM
jgi:hypothetical protein